MTTFAVPVHRRSSTSAAVAMQPRQLSIGEVRDALSCAPLDLGRLENSLRQQKTLISNAGFSDLAAIVPDRLVRHIQDTGETRFRVGVEVLRRNPGPLFCALIDNLGGKLDEPALVLGVKSANYSISAVAQVLVRMDAVVRALDVLAISGNGPARRAVTDLRADQAILQYHVVSALRAMERCPALQQVATQVRTQLTKAASVHSCLYFDTASRLISQPQPYRLARTIVSAGIEFLKTNIKRIVQRSPRPLHLTQSHEITKALAEEKAQKLSLSSIVQVIRNPSEVLFGKGAH